MRKLKPSPSPDRPLPWRVALGLGTAVAGIHFWLLAGSPPTLALQPPPAGEQRPALQTRRIEAAQATPAPVAAMRPPPPPTAPVQPRQTAPTQSAEPVADSAHSATAAASAEPEAVAAEPAAAAVAEPSPAPTAAAPAAAAASVPSLPGSVKLRYELSGQSRGLNYSAEGQLQWQQDGQRYEARMLISSFFLLNPRTMASTGELGPLGVVPRRFSDRARTEQATHFQPEQGRIVFSSNALEAAWQPGAQDRLSLFFQLAGLLAAEPSRFVPGAQLRLWVAGTREADTWNFAVTGTPTLELPVGPLATVALRREPRHEHDQTIEIWCAPALQYLPVRIRISQRNGDAIDQKLAAVEPL